MKPIKYPYSGRQRFVRKEMPRVIVWLAKNPDIELIDIKFQSNVSAVADSGVSAEYWHTSALIIYK